MVINLRRSTPPSYATTLPLATRDALLRTDGAIIYLLHYLSLEYLTQMAFDEKLSGPPRIMPAGSLIRCEDTLLRSRSY